mmetsp:Transcript_37965/g.104386  ORF Transcript_37965/g.104386 Transcript_37965/m.104386 type:complete len:82 (+) Transcript_37965:412-657(+)
MSSACASSGGLAPGISPLGLALDGRGLDVERALWDRDLDLRDLEGFRLVGLRDFERSPKSALKRSGPIAPVKAGLLDMPPL